MASSTRDTLRLPVQRSELAVPASNDRFIRKAAQSAADAIFLDLEDAVAPAMKEKARTMAIDALNDIDWGNRQMAVRVNALDTPWACRDIIELAARAPRLDLILLPKAGSARDVEFVDRLITGIEREADRAAPLGIEVLIETAAGVANVEAIAASSTRLEAMIFGLGDYSIEMRTFDFAIGRPSDRYAVDGPDGAFLNDQWHFALARIANACRANGLRPIDGPYAEFADPIGYRAAALRAAALGFEGKWAIHPSQIVMANEVFTPRDDQIRWANDVMAALDAATEAGSGAVAVDGMLIDLAHGKMARSVIDRAEIITRFQQGAGRR